MTAVLSHMTGPELIEATVSLIDRGDARMPCWTGDSGYHVTGEMVAGHLEAAADLMERQSWDPQLYGFDSKRTIWHALRATAMDGRGDEDTRLVARGLLDLVLRAVTSAPYVDYVCWAAHPRTTLPQVLTLLRGTASLARVIGLTEV